MEPVPWFPPMVRRRNPQPRRSPATREQASSELTLENGMVFAFVPFSSFYGTRVI
jgi:hypothetical protein